jgi:O-antigen biosynthesis protein WbqP|tara:strand:- start:810 stop:1370 length:561 start_codon:yes stop_codon:yes gene_type:complete
MKYFFDILVSIFLSLILITPVILLCFLIKFSSKGTILFWSDRVGKNNIIFSMPKFRTMMVDTPQLATHLLENPEDYYTPLGKFLRKYSLDEIPQLLSIFRGDMSLVGPRPALFNQNDLINLRQKKGIDAIKPGITGLAQVNGRDEMTIPTKVGYDEEYLNTLSMKIDIYILWLTLLKVVRKEGVSH